MEDWYGEIINENWDAWKKHYARIPVKDVHGEWHWLSHIFKRKIIVNVGGDERWKYVYGTLLDVLKDS